MDGLLEQLEIPVYERSCSRGQEGLLQLKHATVGRMLSYPTFVKLLGDGDHAHRPR